MITKMRRLKMISVSIETWAKLKKIKRETGININFLISQLVDKHLDSLKPSKNTSDMVKSAVETLRKKIEDESNAVSLWPLEYSRDI